MFPHFSLMLKRVEHGTAAVRAFSFAEGGDLKQGLSHTLEFDHFPLDFCQLRGCALFHLFTGRLPVHAQCEQFSNLFEREPKVLCPFDKTYLGHSFLRVLPIARGAARRLLQQSLTLIEAHGFHPGQPGGQPAQWRACSSRSLLHEKYTPRSMVQSQEERLTSFYPSNRRLYGHIRNHPSLYVACDNHFVRGATLMDHSYQRHT